MKSKLKRLRCWLIGHAPRGPEPGHSAVIYRCERCDRLIIFDIEEGWMIYHEKT